MPNVLLENLYDIAEFQAHVSFPCSLHVLRPLSRQCMMTTPQNATNSKLRPTALPLMYLGESVGG